MEREAKKSALIVFSGPYDILVINIYIQSIGGIEMKKARLFLSLAVVCVLLVAVSCDPLNPGGDTVIGTELSQNITTPRTLSAGTYTVTSGFYVSADLTIQPGVTIRFANGTWIDVSTGGRILANGTSGSHIVFMPHNSSPTAGIWDEIIIEENGSSFTYCDFSYATTALDIDAANVTVSNCTFTSNTWGVDAENAGTGVPLTNNAFVSNNDPLWINSTINLDGSNTFTGNTFQRVYFNGANLASGQTRTWAETDVPIYISDGFYVEGTLTISAGVTLSFNNDQWISVSTGGTITATGTSGSHIVFTSASPSPSQSIWIGLDFNEDGSSFTYCDFHYADIALNGNTTSTVTRSNVNYYNCRVGWQP